LNSWARVRPSSFNLRHFSFTDQHCGRIRLGIEIDNKDLLPLFCRKCFSEGYCGRGLAHPTLQVDRREHVGHRYLPSSKPRSHLRATEPRSRSKISQRLWEIGHTVSPIGDRLPRNLRHLSNLVDADQFVVWRHSGLQRPAVNPKEATAPRPRPSLRRSRPADIWCLPANGA
jgi:hypothetical protein